MVISSPVTVQVSGISEAEKPELPVSHNIKSWHWLPANNRAYIS
jgi:hypothetical protein